MVIAIMALMAGFALYSGALATRKSAFKAAVYQTAALLREARADAIARGRPTLVMIDVGRRVVATSGTARPRRLALPSDIAITVTAASALSVRSDRVRASGVRFFPNGSSTGGAIHFKEVKEAKEAGGSYLVRINWLTGRVSIEAS